MSQPTPLVVIGAGTALLDVADLVAAINAQGERFLIRGALDDDVTLHGTHLGGVEILGGLQKARDLADVCFVFAIGSYRLRLKRIEIFESLGVDRDRFVTLVHPRADVSSSAALGRGCMVYGNVFVAPRARLGDFAIVYNSAFLSPYCVFGDFAMAAGLAFIGTKARLGIGAFAAGSSVVAPDVTLGSGAMVALASAAYRSVPAGVTVLGNPARAVESMPVPPHLADA